MARPVITVELSLEEEYDEPEGHFEDPETLAWVRREIERGSEWAWFCAKVTATIVIKGKRYEGVNYLGACSYESRESFLERTGYWPQMQQEAIDDLRGRLTREDGPNGEELRVPLSKPVALAFAEAYFDVDLYERGLRIVDDAPAAPVFTLFEQLGVPCYLEGDKGACQVLLDQFMDHGLLTDAPSFER